METGGMDDAIVETLAGGWLRRELRAGAEVLAVDAPSSTAAIALKGGHVLSFAPRGQPDLLYLSPRSPIAGPKPIRGGIPVCWPWFGPHPSRLDLPAHGVARTATWALAGCAAIAESGGVSITLRRVFTAADAGIPLAAELTLEIVVAATLSLSLSTRNTSPTPLVISEALHTYFAVGDIADVTIDGFDRASYLDKTDAGRRKQHIGPLRLEGEVDRLFDRSPGAAVLTDTWLRRRVHITKSGSGASVVWNPGPGKVTQFADLPAGDHRRFVCIESANAFDAIVTIQPGATHRLETAYRIMPL